MQSKFELVITADGSHTVRDTYLDVTYHSIHGALRESEHVFIECGLSLAARSHRDKLKILEVGFGTALNALLTYRFAQEHQLAIDYTSLEPYPLPTSLTRKLNYPSVLQAPNLAGTLENLHDAPPGNRVDFGEYFTLMVLAEELMAHTSTDPYHLVYFDAFGPAAAPDLWSLAQLQHLRSMVAPGSVLVTFCAQGQFKRNLKALGFKVENPPGPPGKREMTRATVLE